MLCNKCSKTIPEDSKYCPFCGEIMTKVVHQDATAEKNYSDVLWALIFLFFAFALVLGLCLGKANTEKTAITNEFYHLEQEYGQLKEDFAKIENVANEYSNMESKMITSSSAGFSPSKYMFVLKPGETETFTIHMLFNEEYTVYTRNSGYSATATFAEDEWVDKVDVTITAQQEGFTEIIYTNSVDERTFSIYIIVLGES